MNSSNIFAENTAYGYKSLTDYISEPSAKETFGANVALVYGSMGKLTYGSFNIAVGSGVLVPLL